MNFPSLGRFNACVCKKINVNSMSGIHVHPSDIFRQKYFVLNVF